MQKVSLVRCGLPFWMALRPQTLRPPQGWPLPELWPTSHRIFVCHRAEGRHWFEEALVAALAHQVMPTHVLQSRVLITCSHCSSGSCCLPVVPLPREPRLACQQRCGVYSQAPAVPGLPRQALFKVTKEILKWENHCWWHAFTPVMLYYSLSLWLLVP